MRPDFQYLTRSYLADAFLGLEERERAWSPSGIHHFGRFQTSQVCAVHDISPQHSFPCRLGIEQHLCQVCAIPNR